MRAHEMPLLPHIFAGKTPEKIRVADGGKHVVSLHAIVAVVGTKLQEFGKVLMPRIEIDRRRTGTHAKLIDRDRRVVDDANPPNDAARRSFEAANHAARCAHLAEIHAHAATEFAHLGKIVDAAIDAIKAVRHGINETTGKLMMGLASVRHGGSCHGDFELGKHVVELSHPAHAVVFLFHGEMEGNSQKHLLRAFYRHMLSRRDHVALQKQVETRVGEQLVALGPQEPFRLLDFGARIMLQDIRAVEVLVGEPKNLVVKRFNSTRSTIERERASERKQQDTCGDKFPFRSFLRSKLNRNTRQGFKALVNGHVGFDKALEFGGKRRKGILFAREILLELRQACVEPKAIPLRLDVAKAALPHDRIHDIRPNAAKLCTFMPVEDVCLRFGEIPLLHQGFLDDILDIFHRRGPARGHLLLHKGKKRRKYIVLSG